MIWLLVGYMWLFIHRPFEVWPWLGQYRIERVYMLATIAYWVVCADKTWIRNRLNVAFLCLGAAILAAAFFGAGAPGVNSTVENWLKIVLFYVLVMSSIRTERDLKVLVVAFVVIASLYELHSYREYLCGRGDFRMGTWRMVGVDATRGDPNSFAASVNYALPMLLPVMALATRKWHYCAIAGLVGLACLCVFLTGSRVGFVGLGGLFLGGIIASRYRWRLVPLLLIVPPLVWVSLSENLQNRYLTLIDPSYGPANAQTSAESREKFFWMAVDIWKENPVFGVGPARFAAESETGLQAHTLYGQTIAELGSFGAVALLLVVACYLMNYFEGRHVYREAGMPTDMRFCYCVLLAATIGLLQLLFFGLGGHNLFRFTWLWYGAFSALALRFLHAAQADVARQAEFALEATTCPPLAHSALSYCPAASRRSAEPE